MEFMEFYEDDFSYFETYLLSVEHQKLCFPEGKEINTEEGTFYYYILEGKVGSFVLHESGKMRMNPTFFKKGAIFPLYAPKSAKRRQSLIFSAIVDSTLLMFDHKTISICLQRNPDFNEAMYACYGGLVTQFGEEIEIQIFTTGLVNLCRFLYKVLEGKGVKNDVLSFTQDELSLYIGLDRSNVARCLKQLRDEKILETGRNKIIIKNKAKLYKYSQLKR